MINTVEGILASRTPTLATVQVGGIGLAVHIPLSTFSALPQPAGRVALFTYLYIREDQLKLYGFATEAECSLFTLLIGVNKIGPAVALQVLSSCKVDEFRGMVSRGDAGALASMVKGVGKKTAERMVIELRDKIGFLTPDEAAGGDQDGREPDAVKALMQLGSNPADARAEVRKAIEEIGAGAPVDAILRKVFENR